MGNSAEFGQSEGVLSKAAQLVADARSDFTAYSRTLNDQLTNMRTQWQGQGGRSFGAFEATWQEKHGVVVSALDTFSASLTETERDNVNTDEEAGGFVNTLTEKLGHVKG
ncbi:WXG100 family type VII secretion target [Nocardioides sambongensis]|uniref:WXG100 family type VII secretion target n=1 Tax=Nocardioides sambongensis TaxID=2589074 RepID=UPI00112D396F|nr:WXG100 family type VII secretion target [Nocardioides sambongensis]